MELASKGNCTGCMACYNACKNKAVKMIYDDKGFYIPFIDDRKCVNCLQCERACPINKNLKRENSKKAYVFQIADKELRLDSTSGGAFTAIATLVIENGGVVFGAGFDDEWKIVHSYAKRKEDLQKFRGSKYVQSNIENCYAQAEKFLLEDNYVCFSGTSCQIAGLKGYLGRDYERLVTIDFACHGIGSSELWNDYINTFKQKITKVQFRNKVYGYAGSTMAIELNRKMKTRGRGIKFYKDLFFRDINIGDCCLACRFKGMERVSDITLFDCWHMNEFDQSMDDDLGTSSILANTDKGLQWIEKTKKGNLLLEVNMEKLIKLDGDMITGFVMPEGKKRDMFWQDYKRMNIQGLTDKYIAHSIKRALIEFSKPILFKFKLLNKIKRKVVK